MRAENLLTAKGLADKKPGAKPYKLSDGGGLVVLVQISGAKLFQYRYALAGKEQTYSIGQLGDKPGQVSLAQARVLRNEARALVKAGHCPNAQKRAAKREAVIAEADPETFTFGHFAAQAQALAAATLEPATMDKWKLHMGYAKAKFGAVPVGEITKAQVLDFLRAWEAAGKIDTMHSIRRKMKTAFSLAYEAELIERNPMDIAPRTLVSAKRASKNHPAITDPARFGELLQAIDGYQGQPATIGCLKLAALTFVRPGELRHARWSEIDFEAALWTIPAARMKTVDGKRYDHLVPLSRQALAILRDMQAIYGSGEFVFPALGKKGTRALSENTVNSALRRMDFAGDEMTGHGFRASANTIAMERLQWPAWIAERGKVIDRQLAHLEPDDTKRAYDRARFIDARTWLMQAWADLCDAMRKGGDSNQLQLRLAA